MTLKYTIEYIPVKLISFQKKICFQVSRHIREANLKTSHFLLEILLHGCCGLIFTSLISLPLPSYLPLFYPPMYISLHPPIHHRLDYANKGSFMSSVLRIFSSPRVCKEVSYYHWPIVKYSLQSVGNPSPLSSILS